MYLQCIVLEKGITIETNPSSNVVIGPIDKYEEHTIHHFIKNGLLSVSTRMIKEYSQHPCATNIHCMQIQQSIWELVILMLLNVLEKYVRMPKIVDFCHRDLYDS